MNYEIGSRIGDYEILQILGAGGMGRVYKVRNVLSDRVEAMKVLLPDLEGNPELADRFMREIKVQASLDHPNIAALHTALRIENQFVMLMEFVEGTPLDQMMEAGPVPIDRAADYFAQVLSALSYAHGRGVVHRDLKPANIMVTAGGRVKLMDFGIAKLTADRKLTQTGSTVGSLYYMSPEQIKGALDLDPRSDLYSLGVSLYEVVTGARPFQGDSEYSIMAAHLEHKPLPPIQITPNLPPGLSEVILQALEKDPATRFQSADAFRAALLHVCKPGQVAASAPLPTAARTADAGGRAEPQVAPPATGPAPARRGLWIAIGAVVAIIVVAAVAVQIPRFRHTAAENPAARTAGTEPAVATQAAEPNAMLESAQPQTPVSGIPSQETAPGAAPGAGAAVQNTAPAKAAAVPRGASAIQSGRSAASMPAMPTPSSAPATLPPASPEPVQSARPAAAPAEDPQTTAFLKEVREQLDLLSIRAETVKSSLDKLRRQQAASGLGLRGDMANAAQRMEYYFSQAESALNRRDADAARKSLDLAEREVSKLESFIGK